MVTHIVAKIDEIVASIHAGDRVNSHVENYKQRRAAFDSLMENPGTLSISKAAILAHPEYPLVAALGEDKIVHDLLAIGVTLDTFGGLTRLVAKFVIPDNIDISRQMIHMKELDEPGWMSE